MKQMIGTLFAAVLFGWVVYSISPEAPCERVERGALPIRTVFDAVRWLGKNYLSTDARIQLLSWSIDADIMSQHFISRLFYGPELNCAK